MARLLGRVGDKVENIEVSDDIINKLTEYAEKMGVRRRDITNQIFLHLTESRLPIKEEMVKKYIVEKIETKVNT